MTTHKQEPQTDLTADQKEAVDGVVANDADATKDAQQLKGEELEQRIAPASFSEFHFTSSTPKSSP